MALGDDEVGVFSLGALLRGHRQAALRLVARQDARRAEEDDGVVDLVALEARVGLHVLGETAQPARRGTLDEGRVAVRRARPLLLGRTQRLRRIARLALRRIGRPWILVASLQGLSAAPSGPFTTCARSRNRARTSRGWGCHRR